MDVRAYLDGLQVHAVYPERILALHDIGIYCIIARIGELNMAAVNNGIFGINSLPIATIFR